MADGSDIFEIAVIERLSDVSALQWDACAGADNPFVRHAFLSALENSASAAPETGWRPRHVVVRDRDGLVVACAPMYLKAHSMGEYVFDWGWAEAYERAGGQYYPKLVSAVPFSPVTGPRLLVDPSQTSTQQAELKRYLSQGMAGMCAASGLSSLHVNFIAQSDVAVFKSSGYLHRIGLQYHWHNKGYATYDDFLGELTSRKRKALKKERREALLGGDITVDRISGDDIKPHHWDDMFAYYMDTSAKKWGRPYLNRDFFTLLGEHMGEKCVLVMAKLDGKTIAGALNILGGDTLYGRYWGCRQDVRYLHFELCYHQAIDIAIERGLKRVEAGAQGDHKIARGYQPVLTHSAHFIAHEGFRESVSHFLTQERAAIREDMDILCQESPYRKAR